ncbi:MAG: hypothetical protein IJW82_02205 [Clostridia bacterium]|nr:hypothetical protein [Clostridia bacterium]
MEKPYLNITELTILLGQGRRYAERVMKHLQEIAKSENYYIPESGRDILIPTHLVKKELKIKEIKLNKNREEKIK